MLEALQDILFPIKWVVEQVLALFRGLLSLLGLGPGSGLAWVLSIVGLVLVVRTALIPVFLKQLKGQRKMMELAPEMKRIQAKYRGKRDVLSRQSMNREMMELYRVKGTSPFSSCLPLFLQIPIFMGLYQVIEHAQRTGGGVGPLNGPLGEDFRDSRLFGVVPLHDSFSHDFSAFQEGRPFNVTTMVVVGVLTVVMIAVQLFTQLKVLPKNTPVGAKETPIYRSQRAMLYFLPIMFLAMGFAFPVGILIYWTTSNIWSAVQQAIAAHRNPSPGSPAFEARRRCQEVEDKKPRGQRRQPVGKRRTKRKQG